MNLFGHRTCRKAGARARSPLFPAPASTAGAGGELPAMREECGADGEWVDERESFGAPLPGTPNVGFQVPADP